LRVVLQRVKEAKVTAEGEVAGEIKKGLVLLVGAKTGDAEEDVRSLRPGGESRGSGGVAVHPLRRHKQRKATQLHGRSGAARSGEALPEILRADEGHRS
jgi:hypothetical protein